MAQAGRTYRFVDSDTCNMCGAGESRQSLIGQRLDKRQGLFPSRKAGITTSVYQCQLCGLIYPNPMPIPASLDQHYNVDPESFWQASYFEGGFEHLTERIKVFQKLSGRPGNGSTFLDVGAGLGKAMVAAEREGFDTYGVEPSDAFRQAAIARMGIAPSRLQLSSVESAEFPENNFDFINFAAVVEHLPDPAASLEKTMKWLKPGGLMYVEVPSSAFLLSRLVRIFYRLTGSNYVINTCPMHVPYHLYEFGFESFVAHGRRTGYSVAHYEYYPCASYMPRLMVPFFNAVMKSTNTGMQLAVWLKKTA